MNFGLRARMSRASLAIVSGILIAIASSTAALASGYGHASIHNFCSQRACADGRNPFAPLIMDNSGAVYGTALSGGLNGAGTVFRVAFDPGTGKWRSKRLHSFCVKADCADGNSPYGRLILDVSGNIYGTTQSGGAFGEGGVFEMLPTAGGYKLKVLHSFACGTEDGCSPLAGLTYAGAATGVPYDGISPLYGTTYQGGAGDTNSGGGGVVFELTKSGKTWTETVIYNFCPTEGCADGEHPGTSLIVDPNGNLYGTTTFGGGAGQNGVVFELSHNTAKGRLRGATPWSQTVLHAFCSLNKCADGGYGIASFGFDGTSDPLLMDASGNIFGTTPGGGSVKHGCCGVVFRIAAPAPVQRGGFPSYTVLYNFCSKNNCLDGANPSGGLFMDQSGNLFGTTQTGGGNNIDGDQVGGGTVFELSGGTLQTLYAFCAQGSCLDGAYPVGGVIPDATGNLFGTTYEGGADTISENTGDGTVFTLTPTAH